MESQHMTQQTFSDFIGISSASLSSIFNGRTKPTLNTVEAIRNKFPTISLDWIMYGTGSMFPDKKKAEEDLFQEEEPFDNRNLFNLDEVVTPPTPIKEYGSRANESKDNQNAFRTEVKYIDKPQRSITEIRIFFDDQTWETFVPKNK